MPIPDDIIQNDFLLNLGDDFIAVDAAGHIVGRAATRDALLRAHAEGSVTLYSATDFADVPAPVTHEVSAPTPSGITASDTPYISTALGDMTDATDTDAPKKPRKKSPAA